MDTKLEKGYFVVNTLRTVAGRTQGPILSLLRQRGIPYQSFFIVNMIKVTGDRNLMEELAARADVARIDANPTMSQASASRPGDGTTQQPTGIEWNVQRVKAPDVWALGFHGEGLVVAGADTGVQWDHPALKNQYRGWNGQQVNHDYNWHDATPDHSPTPIDPHGHGTFTVSEMVGDDGRQPGRRGSGSEMDCLPQHGRRRQRHSRAIHGVLPVPDSALPHRRRPGRPFQGPGFHQ